MSYDKAIDTKDTAIDTKDTAIDTKDTEPLSNAIKNIIDDVSQWDTANIVRLTKTLKGVASLGEIRAWYCKDSDGLPNRKCDGRAHIGYDYPHARSDQYPPLGHDWFIWFLSAGRGAGKTRTGAEYTRLMSNKVSRIALIAPTASDMINTIIEGESGLEAACDRAGVRYKWIPSKRQFHFLDSKTKCIAITYSGEEPQRLRGAQHGYAWLDEPSHIRLINPLWDNLQLGLRLGTKPKICITSTPLPNTWTKKIQARKDCVVARVSTYANMHNLASTYKDIVSTFEGTKAGRQELYGEILPSESGLMFSENLMKDELVASTLDIIRKSIRVVIAIDPAGSVSKRADETGISVCALGQDGIYYVLADLSGKLSVARYIQVVREAYKRYECDCLVVERNFGGDIIKKVFSEGMSDISGFRLKTTFSSRGKVIRAEPVANLFEQGKVRFVRQGDRDTHKTLKDELVDFGARASGSRIEGQGSDNRVDALVFAISELAGGFKRRGMKVLRATGDATYEDKTLREKSLDKDKGHKRKKIKETGFSKRGRFELVTNPFGSAKIIEFNSLSRKK